MRTSIIVVLMSLIFLGAITLIAPTREASVLEESIYTPPPELLPLKEEMVEEDEVTEVVVEEPLPSSILHDVAFTAQAPFAQWSEPLYQDACEEASVLMAARWVLGKNDGEKLDPALATDEIERLGDVSVELFDTFVDTSAEDTLWILQYELPGADIELLESPTIEDMKRVLADDGLLIVPIDGQMLNNPYYTEPGPERHMLVIIGFDDDAQEFITNDPGTSRGAGFRYGYESFSIAMRDYPTGNEVPITTITKPAISVYRGAEATEVTKDASGTESASDAL